LKAKTRERLQAKLDAREKEAAETGWIVLLISKEGKKFWICKCSPPERTEKRGAAHIFASEEAALETARAWEGQPPLWSAWVVHVTLAPGPSLGADRVTEPKANGAPAAPLAVVPPPEDPVLFAMRQELRGQLDKPLTGRSLFLLEQTAMLARQLFALRTAPDGMAKLRAKTNGGFGMSNGLMVPNPIYTSNGMTIGGSDLFDGDGGESSDALGVMQGVPMPGALATAPGVETFGASAIRELMGNVSKRREESIGDLMEDIGRAERLGEKEIAAALREKIRLRLGAPLPFGPPERRIAKKAAKKRRLRIYDKPASPPTRSPRPLRRKGVTVRP